MPNWSHIKVRKSQKKSGWLSNPFRRYWHQLTGLISMMKILIPGHLFSRTPLKNEPLHRCFWTTIWRTSISQNTYWWLLLGHVHQSYASWKSKKQSFFSFWRSINKSKGRTSPTISPKCPRQITLWLKALLIRN